ncbi:MAG: hypothetical protein NT018_05280 [Armatimonadetes bacterium]|nr:hypothetical protein [Armatimonadota bacterium]
MLNCLQNYFRIPDEFLQERLCDALRDSAEFWALRNRLPQCDNNCLSSFDLDQLIEHLLYETYVVKSNPGMLTKATQLGYYLVRPLMSVSMRKHLQRRALKGWGEISFPHWPVDTTVDELMKQTLTLAIDDASEVPFIWFWPEGHKSSLIITHDVETAAGRDFCETLMDIDESYGFKSAFQIVPEQRYEAPESFLNRIREHGHEVNIHGLNHDGRLFSSQELFSIRAEKINEYGRKFGAKGFRSPVLYRNADWMHKLDFEYDMTFPNVGHLDAQRGGCCTVMPYFIGNMVELPLTTIQDYSLFNILGNFSIDLWKEQIAIISANNGLISFNIHPDYLKEKKAMDTYTSLLAYLKDYVAANNVWAALPGEVAGWWRARNNMTLKQLGETPGSDSTYLSRARRARAFIQENQLILEPKEN